MEESDSMHRAMEESKPALKYLNKISEKIKEGIKEMNKEEGEYLFAYTFDAGPNAHIFTLDKNKKKIVSFLKEIEGVEEIIECKIGDGLRYSESHLM
jgi:diphosphomevalonate decarboxylase